MTGKVALSARRLDEIEARLKAASPGPWDIDEQYHGMVYCNDSLGSMVANTASKYTMAITHAQETANAQFIANAPADLADLLAEVDRLRSGEATP